MMWNFKKFGENIAAVDDKGNHITYLQLMKANDALADQIKGRCLVFVLCTNSIGAIVGYTSFLNNNIVPLLLDSKLDSELLEYLMNTYKPAYLWLPEHLTDQFNHFSIIYQDYRYVLMKTDYEEEYPLFPELALLLTTSGSTGSPKLVRQSYTNMDANLKSIVKYLELDSSERPITTLPMNYTYGLSIINSHLAVGATLLLTDRTLMEKEFWNFFREQKATSFGGVPYTYEILDKLKVYYMDLPSLKTMTQAGGKLSPELHRKFAEYALENKKHFIVMYGQTEATARMSYLPFEKSIEKYGSMGIAIPGGKFSLIDEYGNLINSPEVIGELVYEGPNVTLGYAECGNDLIKGDERFGRLITGDMAKMDQDGYYYIVGRKKRFLKLYGNRVNLDEAERMIKSNFGYMDCACTGIDDNMLIFINDESLAHAVRKFISEKTGLNSAAFQVRVINQIPKNESGKTLYVKLEDYYKD